LHALHLSQRAIPDDLAGKSIYFLLVDRFARPEGAPHEPCEGKKWCNGTLTGLIEKLPYIHGMGFDCVWITPVVKQSEARCFGERCLDPYHGYWPEDWYSIDPHFGSADDLKLLSRMLREQGTCLMMDTVLHHVRPVSSSEDLVNVRPFNRTEDFWMWNASDGDTFDEYAKHPMQALVPHCDPGGCSPPNITEHGWFMDLPALKIGGSERVRTELDNWIKFMMKEFQPTALRLDMAAYMPIDYLRHFRQLAGVPILGEVTSPSWEYVKNFLTNRPKNNAVDIVTHFSLLSGVRQGFCGTSNISFDMNGNKFIDETKHASPPDFAELHASVDEQLLAHEPELLDRLSHFLDSHDEERFSQACDGHTSRLKHAITFTMLLPGAPVVYYGTEQVFAQEDNRAALWSSNFTRGEMYYHIAALNRVRKQYLNRPATQLPMKVHFSDESSFVFSRGNATEDMLWVFLNNDETTHSPRRYCAESSQRVPRLPPAGSAWVDVLSGERARYDVGTGCFLAPNGEPKILVARPIQSLVQESR